MKFRVLDGKHQVFERTTTPDGESNSRNIRVTQYPRGSIIESDVDLVKRFAKSHVKKYKRVGSIIESDVDLVKRFAKSHVKKYKRVPDDTPVSTALEADPEPESVSTLEAPEPEDALSDMTKAQLLEVAEEENIDLGGATLKADIRAVIRQYAGG